MTRQGAWIGVMGAGTMRQHGTDSNREAGPCPGVKAYMSHEHLSGSGARLTVIFCGDRLYEGLDRRHGPNPKAEK